ncbi:beta-glucuronidase, partial [Bacteroides uniformis]
EEIKNFTGPVQARNFEIFRELLDKNHMLDQAHDFFRASGALTAIEYKDVIEAQLRTYLKGGFQLLSMNDFTGQGYAPVGILDPFWNTKGLITPEKWREFCAPTVALLRFDKRALYNDEVFEGKAEIYNYGPTLLKNAKINWSITDSNGKTLKSGKLKTQTVGKNGVFPLGSFSYALNNITEPQKLTVHLSVAHVKNSWDIWVYPRHSNLMQSTSEVLYTTVFDEKAKQHLADGKKVVLCPKPSKVKGRKSVFHNHFWNPIMFKWPPMTIGCLIHDDQPIFEHFITSYHTDWQWWDILENAKVIEMKDAPAALRPFIQVIDHYDNNEKLGIGFEAKVKKGSLLVLAVDTQKNINERPATQQLLESIDRYVKSDKFAPQITVDESYIESFLKK